MSCHSCGIIPPFLLVSIRDHVAANPEFYADLSTDPVPGERGIPYDEREYLEYWRASEPEGAEMSALSAETKPPENESNSGKREKDHSTGASSHSAAAAAAGAGAGRQTDSDSSDDDGASSDDERGVTAGGGGRTRAAPSVLSENLITQLQPPSSWQYTGWDAAAQRGAGGTIFVTAAMAAPITVIGGGAVAVASSATATAATHTAVVTAGGVAVTAVAKSKGGASERGAAAIAATKKATQRAARLTQFYFARQDIRAYLSEKHCHQIFISNAATKQNFGDDISHESPYPRTLAGIQARSNNPCAIRTYQAIERTLAFLSERFNRNSIDNDGQMIIASIHYPSASVGGHRRLSNAFWTYGKQQMLIGDGDGLILNELGMDLTTIAHETIHGMTHHTVGLRYRGQSGALDEHISDVFAILVKNNVLWESPSANITGDRIWYIGEDLVRPTYMRMLAQRFPGQFFHALRSMKNPGSAYNLGTLLTARTGFHANDPQVSKISDYDHTTADNGGVHINSGIPNKAFYLFATTVGNEALKTAGKVWYATITSGRLHRNAQFIDFANETIRHVEPINLPALRKAWSDVGVAV